MGFMQKAVSAMVTKYGKVTEGKYEGHFLCLGHDPDKNNKPQIVDATAPKVYDFLIFMMDDEGKARHSIKDEVLIAFMQEEDENTLTLCIAWKTGEQSTVTLFKTKTANAEESGLSKGIGMLMKMGGAGSKQPVDKDKELYGDFNDCMFSLLLRLNLETMEWYVDFAREHNLLQGSFLAYAEKVVATVQAKQEEGAGE